MPKALNIKKFLSQTNPFKVLPESETGRLAERVQLHSFSRGQTIYAEGDPADSVWVVAHGRVEIFKYTSEGRPLAIENVLTGELFGTLCRLGGTGRTYPCTAVAAEPTEVLRISDKGFLDLYHRHPAMVVGVCSLCSQRLNAVQNLSCTSQEPVERRLAMLIVQLHKKHGVILPYTKRELAEQVGTTVETTIRIMSRFQKKGWVSSSRGKLQVNSLRAIQKLVEMVH